MNKSLSLFLFLCCFHQILSLIPPEVYYDFRQYITSLGYPYQEYTVVTQDGYKLTYFRIQKHGTQIQETGLPVVLIHHGLLDSCDSYIINDPDQAPALLLADRGYDVWLANSRGNPYALGHVDPVNYNSADSNSKFWDFSFEEMAKYDLPAGMKYVGDLTHSLVNYIGYSLGNTIMFHALARQDPTVIAYLNKFFACAPVVYISQSTSVAQQLEGILQVGTLNYISGITTQNKKFGFQTRDQKTSSALLCATTRAVCIARNFLTSNWNPTVDNTDKLVISQAHFPAGTSVQNFYYFQQLFNNGNTFKEYDYGKDGNLANYGSETPPILDLNRITQKVYMFAGQYDQIASPPDAEDLRDDLPNRWYKSYPLGHSSFIYAKNVAGTYMKDLIAFMESHD